MNSYLVTGLVFNFLGWWAYFKRKIHLALVLFLLCLFMLFLSSRAQADIVTEWGWGVKLPHSTSAILLPICQQVHLTGWQQNSPDSPNFGKGLSSCGGDNPAFIGWPIAWESDWFGKRDGFKLRGGWFHYSNWFDGGKYLQGGDSHETSMDMAAFTITFNWTNWARNR